MDHSVALAGEKIHQISFLEEKMRNFNSLSYFEDAATFAKRTASRCIRNIF
jgi:hypothetical protein